MNAALQQLAAEYKAENGVVFRLVPFRNVSVGVRGTELNAITPHFRYTHKETGEQVFVEPLSHALAVERKTESEWTVEDMWSAAHYNFMNVDSVTLSIEFPTFNDETPFDLCAFAAYWNSTYSTIAERWAAYQALVSTDMNNLWVEAYNATRPKDPDPQAGSATKKTRPSSRRSKPSPDA